MYFLWYLARFGRHSFGTHVSVDLSVDQGRSGRKWLTYLQQKRSKCSYSQVHLLWFCSYLLMVIYGMIKCYFGSRRLIGSYLAIFGLLVVDKSQ